MRRLHWLILLSSLILPNAQSSPLKTSDVAQSSSTDQTRTITAADLTDKGEYFTNANGQCWRLQVVVPVPIPDEFEVELRLKPGGFALLRLSYYMAVSRGLASAALRPWEQEINLYHFTPVSDIGFDFKSGMNPPFYEISTVMWTFISVYLNMNLQGFWSEMSWITKLDPQVVGVGKVYLSISDGRAAKDDSAGNSTESVDFRNRSTSAASDQMASPNLPTLQYNSSSNAITSRDLALGLAYVRNGRTFQISDVFTSVNWLIITAAQFDPYENAITMGRYDPEANLSLSIFPWHDDGELKWWMSIDALWMFLDLMSTEVAGGRWAEARARLRVSGVNMAKLIIVKGRITPDQLESAFDGLGEEDFDIDATSTGNAASANANPPSTMQTYDTS